MADTGLQYQLNESDGSIAELRLSGHVTGDALAEAACDLAPAGC